MKMKLKLLGVQTELSKERGKKKQKAVSYLSNEDHAR